MSKDQNRVTCRVCEAQPLVGYYGLCQECADATDRFWASRSQKLARQEKNLERQMKDDAIRNRPPQSRPDDDAARVRHGGQGYVQPAKGRSDGKPRGKTPRKRVQRSPKRA